MIRVIRDYRVKEACCTYTKGYGFSGHKFESITIQLKEPLSIREVGHELIHALLFIIMGQCRSKPAQLLFDYFCDWLCIFTSPHLLNRWRLYLRFRGSRSRFPYPRPCTS